MNIQSLLKEMEPREGSDLFLKVGGPPYLRVNGKLEALSKEKLSHDELVHFAVELMGPDRRREYTEAREMNFAFELNGGGRFRANVMWQRGAMALVIRHVRRATATFEALALPKEVLEKLANEKSGLVLVTGSTDSGKSTTCAAFLDHINRTQARHIMTLEDPIEFQFTEDQAIINQREIGTDTRSFGEGLKNALRQSPDVLFISDLRDLSSMEAALLAAEAGQLVISCLHSRTTLSAIERIIAFFPAAQHELIRLRLSMTLKGILSLRLLERADGSGRVPACEVLVATPTVRDKIREGETRALTELIADGALFGMRTFTQSLYQLCKDGKVTQEEALRCADSAEELTLALNEIRPTKNAAA